MRDGDADENQSTRTHNRGKQSRARPDERCRPPSVQTFEADAPAATGSRRRTRVDHTRHGGTHDHAEETVANGTVASTSMTSTHSARRGRKVVLVVPADHAQHGNVRAAEQHGRERAEKNTWVSC